MRAYHDAYARLCHDGLAAEMPSGVNLEQLVAWYLDHPSTRVAGFARRTLIPGEFWFLRLAGSRERERGRRRWNTPHTDPRWCRGIGTEAARRCGRTMGGVGGGGEGDVAMRGRRCDRRGGVSASPVPRELGGDKLDSNDPTRVFQCASDGVLGRVVGRGAQVEVREGISAGLAKPARTATRALLFGRRG